MYCKYGLVCSQLGPKSPPPSSSLKAHLAISSIQVDPLLTIFIVLFKSFKTNFETYLLERDYKTKQ